MAPTLHRRAALLGLGGLTSLWAVPVVAAAQATGVLAWTPKALTQEQARTLAAACERIIPTTDTPGAIAAGVPQFIDRQLADWFEPPEAERLRAGLAHLDAQARAKDGAPFAALPGARQDALLREADTEGQAAAKQLKPHWFLSLREMTTVAYFTSETGATKALRYDPIPGDYRGCVPLKDIGRGWATT